jgi:hypothetical protein
LAPGVKEAVEEIRRHYAGRSILVAEDKQGGACLLVEAEPLGTPYANADTWVGFHVTHNSPYADVYPHFVRPDLARADGRPLGEGMTTGHTFPALGVLKDAAAIPSRTAVQVSRRSNRRDPAGIETPLLKLLKVLQWMRTR